MNDSECLRTSTNVWRSRCDHCELMANCMRKPIRHTFATGETSIIFETPHERPRMLTNTYECLAITCYHYELMANCIRKPSGRLALVGLCPCHSVKFSFYNSLSSHWSLVVAQALRMIFLSCFRPQLGGLTRRGPQAEEGETG